jgi:hypothetical protein
MRIGKSVEGGFKKLKDGEYYLVVIMNGGIPDPRILKGSTIKQAYFRTTIKWPDGQSLFMFHVDNKYASGHRYASRHLKGMYETLKELYAPYPQVLVLTGLEYNAIYPEDADMDDRQIVVCDNADQKYDRDDIFHIDGAFSITEYKKSLKYQWWPYPEKPIQGREAIITHIKLHHLPNEQKSTTPTV